MNCTVIPWTQHGISGRNLYHKILWSSHGMTMSINIKKKVNGSRS
ncbi:hypothetical protein [Rickettsia asembonensis]|nr:hypothetical protein [Rickettsia asembonensis]